MASENKYFCYVKEANITNFLK